MSKIKKTYTTLSFSTNKTQLLPLSLLKLFLSSKYCSNINHIDKHCIEYDYLLDNTILVNSTIAEATELNKKYSISNISDSYLIIIDLEKEDLYQELDYIILYIINNCLPEKKIFVLGAYNNAKNIREDLKEENIKDYIDNKSINYEYLELNINNENDLINIIEFITKQSLTNNDIQNDNALDKGKSNSACHIF